jgi:EmrB/QacA subfamily drug resistance transporter
VNQKNDAISENGAAGKAAAGRQATGLDPELRRLALVVVAGAIMTILDTTIVNVAITPLGRDLHTSLSTIQWVLTGYTLALSMAIPITGWAVERFGAKTTWITSLLLFIAGSILCGVAWNVGSLIAFRVLQGVGGGMIMPVGQVMLARKAGPDRMARVMSVIAVPAMLGPVLGPVIGGLIIDDLSWRWMFYVNVPLCALALVLALKILPPDTDRSAARIDGIGLALLPPGLAFVVYGLSKAGSDSTQMAIWLVAGALVTAAFVVHALRGRGTPLVNVRVFGSRAFSMSSIAMFVYSGALFGFMVVLPIYFQVVRGESPLRAGLLVAPLGLGAIVTMPLSGRLADRVVARAIVVPGMLIVAGAAVVFTQIHTGTSLGLLAGMLFVAGLGHGTVMPPVMGSAYQGMRRPDIPGATATFNVALRVGSSFGTAILAVVLQEAIAGRIHGASGGLSSVAGLRGKSVTAELTSAFGVSFWWVAAIAVIAVIPALFIPPRPAAGAAPAGDDPAARPSSTAMSGAAASEEG